MQTIWFHRDGKIEQSVIPAVLNQMVRVGLVFRVFKKGNTHHTKDPHHNSPFKSTHKTFYQFNMPKIATHRLSVDVLRARNLRVVTDAGNQLTSVSVRLNVRGEFQCGSRTVEQPTADPEWNEGLEMPEWNRELNKDESAPWISLVDLEGPVEVEVVGKWGPSSSRRLSLASHPRPPPELLTIQLDLRCAAQSVELASNENAVWHFERRAGTTAVEELGQDEGVEMGPLLRKDKAWPDYTGPAPALQLRHVVESVLDETSDVSGKAAAKQTFLEQVKNQAGVLEERLLHPSVNPWTIRARILEVDSMHIKPTGEVFAELACNGKVSKSPIPIDRLVEKPGPHHHLASMMHLPASERSRHSHEETFGAEMKSEMEPRALFTDGTVELESVPANLATDELELVIFAKTKSHSKIERVDLSSATLAFDHWELNPFQRKACAHERFEGDAEPRPQWVKLYTKHGLDGHMVYNGRVKMAIWRVSSPKARKRKFWLMALLTSKTFWFVFFLLLMHQSGFLYTLLLYPFWAIMWIVIALPILVFCPGLLGLFVSVMVTKVGTGGFPITFGSLFLVPWIRNGALHLLVTAEDFAFSNPPGFPRKDFIHAKHVSIHFRFPLTLFSLSTIRAAMKYKWSPFPTVCAALTHYNPDTDPHGHKVENQLKLGVLGIEHFEVNGVVLVFEMFRRQFNINGFVRLLAEGKAFGQGWPKEGPFGVPLPGDDEDENEEFQWELPSPEPLPKDWTGLDPLVFPAHSDPSGKLWPNCLIVQVVEGRNVDVKNKTLDPMVTVAVRHQSASTPALLRGTSSLPDPHNPKWGGPESTFRFHVTDPSAVLHVTMKDEDATRFRFVGQFIYTLKFFRVKPDHAFHCEDQLDASNAHDRVGNGFQIEGWFKLADHNFLNHGDPELFPPDHGTNPNEVDPDGKNPKGPGCVRLKMSWIYDKRFDKKTAEGRDTGEHDYEASSGAWTTSSPKRKKKQTSLRPLLSMVSEPPDMTALQQLQLNSAETQLRMGNQHLVTHMLDTFPLLLDVKVCFVVFPRSLLGVLILIPEMPLALPSEPAFYDT